MTNTPHVEHALDATIAHTTDTTPAAVADDLIVTTCPDHGVKVAGDFRSFCVYVSIALQHAAAGPHDDGPGLECWVCCDDMVIDPAGLATVAEAGAAVSHWASWPPMDDGPILTDEEQIALVTALRVAEGGE